MDSQDQDGLEADALSFLLLRFVRDEGDAAQLRETLSGFTHRCRNLLNGMKMGFYFVHRRAEGELPRRLTEVEEAYGSIERLFDQLQRIYRPMTLTRVRASFGCLVGAREREWRDEFRRIGADLEIVRPAEESPGEFDPSHLGQALDAFVSWRAPAIPPGSTARLAWRTEDQHFEVTWEETHEEIRRAGDGASAGTPSSGLEATNHAMAMPLLARILTAHHGVLEWSAGPGFRVRLQWPLVQETLAECAAG